MKSLALNSKYHKLNTQFYAKKYYLHKQKKCSRIDWK